jgi:hypothetical protein
VSSSSDPQRPTRSGTFGPGPRFDDIGSVLLGLEPLRGENEWFALRGGIR